MKILRIIPSMNPKLGGPSQGIRNSIPALRKLGIENEVVCLDDSCEQFLQNSSFVIHALGKPKTRWAYNKALKYWLVRHLTDYDFVIIHGLWLYHSYISIRVFQILNKSHKVPKIYVMPHGMLDPWFQRAANRKLKALRNEIYWKLIEKETVNTADGVLFTCEQELLSARQTFKGYNPKMELNIGYGIQEPPLLTMAMQQAFYNQVPSLKNRPFLLFLSRIHPKKGIDLLIDAYLELDIPHSSLPDLVIAGPLDGDYSKLMEAKAKSSSKIHFTGMLNGELKWGAFYSCEAFILPSHQENFGISVVEALACFKPVLITNKVNIYKEIEAGNGGIIEIDNVIGVKSLLTQWISLTRDQKKSMSVKAKNVYLKNYEIDQTAKLLQQVLAEN